MEDLLVLSASQIEIESNELLGSEAFPSTQTNQSQAHEQGKGKILRRKGPENPFPSKAGNKILLRHVGLLLGQVGNVVFVVLVGMSTSFV